MIIIFQSKANGSFYIVLISKIEQASFWFDIGFGRKVKSFKLCTYISSIHKIKRVESSLNTCMNMEKITNKQKCVVSFSSCWYAFVGHFK